MRTTESSGARLALTALEHIGASERARLTFPGADTPRRRARFARLAPWLVTYADSVSFAVRDGFGAARP